VARELGYDPEQALAARRLRYRRSERQVVNRLVGLYFSLRQARGPYFYQLLEGLGEVLDGAEFALLSNWAPSAKAPPVRLPAIVSRGEVDGVLTLSGVPHIDQLVALLRRDPGFGDRPIVSMMEPEEGCSAVLTADSAGGYALMQHLLGLGHRQVLYVDFHTWQNGQRVEGCRRACREHGLDPLQAVRALPYYTEDERRSRASLLHSLAQYPRCRAIFGGNDMTACLLAAWLREAGVQIPQDCSLIGFDDTHTLAAPTGANLLTTVRQPLIEVGRRAAALLVQHIRGEITEPRTIELPVELVVRGSTAPPPPA
jgi:LacI family transcriptional regulator